MKRYVLLALLPLLLLSKPFDPREVRTLTQPDGTEFQARAIGDEHYWFIETVDGYVVMKNEEGWWTYAKLVNGLFAPSEYIVGKDPCPFRKHLRPDPEAVKAIPGNEYKVINRFKKDWEERWEKVKKMLEKDPNLDITKALGITGPQRTCIILVDFSDSVNWGGMTADSYAYMFLGVDSASAWIWESDSTYKGCMNNYYWEASYFQSTWHGQVARAHARREYTYYGQVFLYNDYYVINDKGTTPSLLNECTGDVDPYIDFTQYDTDGDDRCDHLIIVHTGLSEQQSWDKNSIATARWSGVASYAESRDGIDFNNFFIQSYSEEVGTACHENFHDIGAPDLYDYGYHGNPVGEWCLMDLGCFNGGEKHPSFPCAMLRWDIDLDPSNGITGWVSNIDGIYDTIVAKPGSEGKYLVAAAAVDTSVYHDIPRIYLLQDSTFNNVDEYFVLENRTKIGYYEGYLPDEGIIIYHYDPSERGSGGRANEGPPDKDYYCVWVETPSVDPTWAYAYWNTDADSMYGQWTYRSAYSAEDGETELGYNTVPDCRINHKSPDNPPDRFGPVITSISYSDSIMSFVLDNMDNATTVKTVGYVKHDIFDNLSLSAYNNNDGVMNSSETESLVVTLKNYGGTIGGGLIPPTVWFELTTSSSDIILVDPTDTVSSNWGTDATRTPSFKIRVRPDATRDTPVRFKIYVYENATKVDSVEFGDVIDQTRLAIVDSINVKKIMVSQGISNPQNYTFNAIGVKPGTLLVNATDVTNFKSGVIVIDEINKSYITHWASPAPNNLYVMGIDWNPLDNYFYLTARDSCYVVEPATGNVVRRFKWYGIGDNDPNKVRIRSVTFAPPDVPFYPCSLFTQWQCYDTTLTADHSRSESLIIQKRVASGTAGRVWATPFAGATQFFLDLWNYEWDDDDWWNFRGLEHIGKYLLRCLFYLRRMEIQLLRAPTSATSKVDRVLKSLPSPVPFGQWPDEGFPAYDIGFYGLNKNGEPWDTTDREKRGNHFYLWVGHWCAQEARVYKIDLTAWLLPSKVNLEEVYDNGNGQAVVKWTNKEFTADSIEYVTKYIIYRSTVEDELGDSVGTVNETPGVVDSFVEPLPPAKATYYYRVVPVNYYGYSTTSSNAGVLSVLANLFTHVSTMVLGRDVKLTWKFEHPDAYMFTVERKKVREREFHEVGRVIAEGKREYEYVDGSVPAGRYVYRIRAFKKNGTVLGSVKTSPVDLRSVSDKVVLYPVVPNVRRTGDLTIRFSLPERSRVKVAIFNVLGAKVRDLVNGELGPGLHAVTWDGCTGAGRKVAPGIYFYRLEVEGPEKVKLTGKVILLE